MQTAEEQDSGEEIHIWSHIRQWFMKLPFSSGTTYNSADPQGSYSLYEKGPV